MHSAGSFNLQTSWCAQHSHFERVTRRLHARSPSHHGSEYYRACATLLWRERWIPWKLPKSWTDILAHGQAESDHWWVPSSAMPHVPKIFVIFNQPPVAVSCSSLKRTREPLKIFIKQQTRNKYFLLVLNIFRHYLRRWCHQIIMNYSWEGKVQWVKW